MRHHKKEEFLQQAKRCSLQGIVADCHLRLAGHAPHIPATCPASVTWITFLLKKRDAKDSPKRPDMPPQCFKRTYESAGSTGQKPTPLQLIRGYGASLWPSTPPGLEEMTD